MVNHRDGWVSVRLGTGLLVEQCGEHIQWMTGEPSWSWKVLWSRDGKVMRHRGYELRVTHEGG